MSVEDKLSSADRVMAVLLFLATRTRPVPAAAIQRACDLPRSSTYHLLNAMRARNFVAYSRETRTWSLGVAAFEIGSAYLRSDALEWVSRPVLTELADQTQEVAHLAILHGNDVLYLAKAQPTGVNAPRLVTEVGVRLPAHLTSVGRAILMRLPSAQVKAIYPVTRPLSARTTEGPRLHSQLERMLADDRKRGYVVEEGCTTTGVTCIAAPVIGHDGRPSAAINITFVSARHPRETHERLAEQVMSAAAQMSETLGGQPDALPNNDTAHSA
jgi:DNA-binding IclR family transcriptional regulator